MSNCHSLLLATQASSLFVNSFHVFAVNTFERFGKKLSSDLEELRAEFQVRHQPDWINLNQYKFANDKIASMGSDAKLQLIPCETLAYESSQAPGSVWPAGEPGCATRTYPHRPKRKSRSEKNVYKRVYSFAWPKLDRIQIIHNLACGKVPRSLLRGLQAAPISAASM